MQNSPESVRVLSRTVAEEIKELDTAEVHMVSGGQCEGRDDPNWTPVSRVRIFQCDE